ncbi:MAG: flagellar basal body-associated FliL family protein [Aquabacterium sp.]|nr:flagellar basal body-associated FliL family protein [Aquabacterium sp.]
MAIAEKIDQPGSGISDWLLELTIGLVAVALGLGVWAYTHWSSPNTSQSRPKPVWLNMPKVTAQTADGRMVNIKVNLRLANGHDADALEPHIPAFTTLLQEASTDITRDDLRDQAGIVQFGKAVKASFNRYLKTHDVAARVKDVAFDELMPLP